jgi:hypothetical protein
MAFNGNEGTYITLAQGTTFTASYRNANPSATKAHFYGKTKLQELLNQSGCVGIRMYRAIDDTGATQLVLVGVSSNEADMTSGLILDRSVLCPPYCDVASALNGGSGG